MLEGPVRYARYTRESFTTWTQIGHHNQFCLIRVHVLKDSRFKRLVQEADLSALGLKLGYPETTQEAKCMTSKETHRTNPDVEGATGAAIDRACEASIWRTQLRERCAVHSTRLYDPCGLVLVV